MGSNPLNLDLAGAPRSRRMPTLIWKYRFRIFSTKTAQQSPRNALIFLAQISGFPFNVMEPQVDELVSLSSKWQRHNIIWEPHGMRWECYEIK